MDTLNETINPQEDKVPNVDATNKTKIKWEGQEYILSKIAALEVYNIHKGSKSVGIIAIISSLLIASINAAPAEIRIYLAAGTAGIVSMGLAFMVWKDISRMKYLKQQYSLNVK